jgi:hypothetical protein
MRMQSAIVVAIGVFICLTLVVMNYWNSELTRLTAELKHAGSQTDEIKDEIGWVELLRGLGLIGSVVGISLLTGCFFYYGHRRFRFRYRNLPCDDSELLNRLMCKTTPFQTSILTVLALMLAVALVCGTVRWLWLTPK